VKALKPSILPRPKRGVVESDRNRNVNDATGLFDANKPHVRFLLIKQLSQSGNIGIVSSEWSATPTRVDMNPRSHSDIRPTALWELYDHN